MAVFNKLDQIRKYIKSRVGDPIVALCENEAAAVDEAVEMASVQYWVALPYIKLDSQTVEIWGGETVVKEEDIKEKLFVNSSPGVKDSAYFIGVVKYDLTKNISLFPSNLNYFDEKLLGKDLRYSFASRYDKDPRYLANQILLYNSNESLLLGNMDIRYDDAEKAVIFIAPSIQGRLTVWYGWGFPAENTIEYMPMRNFVLFRKMCALEFLEMIIATRSSVQLHTDYRIDVADLVFKRDSLKEEVMAELKDTAMITGQWS